MNPETRTLIKVRIDDAAATSDLVERLMGKKPESRFDYITQNARFAEDLDV